MQNTWNSENADNELNQQTRDLGFVGQTGAQSIKYFYVYYNLEKRNGEEMSVTICNRKL